MSGRPTLLNHGIDFDSKCWQVFKFCNEPSLNIKISLSYNYTMYVYSHRYDTSFLIHYTLQ